MNTAVKLLLEAYWIGIGEMGGGGLPNAKAKYTKKIAVPKKNNNKVIINPLTSGVYRLPFFKSAMEMRIIATQPNSMGADTRIEIYLSFPLNNSISPFEDRTHCCED